MIVNVPLGQIEDNPFQKRLEYGDIAELAERIHTKRHDYPDTIGLMQPPRGRLIYKDKLGVDVVGAEYYDGFISNRQLYSDKSLCVQLTYGHRRVRAIRHLAESQAVGYEAVDYVPIDVGYLDDDQMLDAVWSENYERKDISDVEMAELISDKLERLRANGGGSQRDVAESWGLARPTVSNLLRLLGLPEEVKQANRDGALGIATLCVGGGQGMSLLCRWVTL